MTRRAHESGLFAFVLADWPIGQDPGFLKNLPKKG
jgi:hypothetical protein